MNSAPVQPSLVLQYRFSHGRTELYLALRLGVLKCHQLYKTNVKCSAKF